MDYNDGKWHGWNGGECPVHPKTIVDVALSDGVATEVVAGDEFWNEPHSPVLSFRVVKEYRVPREFIVTEAANGDLSVLHAVDGLALPASLKTIRVREVL